MLPRRAYLEIEIDGSDISQAFSNLVLDFTYVDRASGESDTVDLVVTDKIAKFIDEWYPLGDGSTAESGSSDYSAIARALQQGTSSAHLQELIDASDLTPEQGRELQRLTPTATWRQFTAENPQYRGESGKITLINDIKKRIPGGTPPQFGSGGALSFRARIRTENWYEDGDTDSLDTGRFIIDGCDLSGPPDKFTIKSVSIPVTASLKREEKTNTWEEATLQKIAQSISGNAGLDLIYEVESDIQLDRVDQSQQSDMSFLMDLCNKYGVALKVTNEKMVLFEESVYEEKDVVDTFDKSEIGSRILGYSFSQDINGTVSKVELNYKDPKSGLVAEGSFEPPNPPATGQKLVLNERPGDMRGDNFRNGVDNSSGSPGGTFDTGVHPFNDITADFSRPRADVSDNANRICKARCRENNKKEWTCTLRMLGNVKMVGGVTIDITNWGKYSGKYMVDEATHKKGGSYGTTVTAHKVLGY